ncbi:unnamed protein product [Triticum aestivum]|uniref:Transposase (putative) gypsy type domain-containing protein n=1 Tax=Triticum aestivum TaxID=4565 RepID=A0A7H4LPK5_WHEAT|nr:unnamed protein product [Triticum aestivum]
MANDGLIPHGIARLPGKEWQPQPEEGECVLLATHVDRGFSLPPSVFFRGFLNFFGAQLHHFTPNSIAYLAAFVSLCENFLGCRPHWGLFKHIFMCRSQTVKKASPGDERTQVVQICGGLGIQVRDKSTFPAMTFPESVRGWQSTWFYCQNEPTPGQSSGLPQFTMDRVNKPSSLKVIPEERADTKMLMDRVVQLVRDGVTGMDLLEVFLRRRIQPLQFRSHCMWLYRGTEDETRIHPEAANDATVERWMAAITGNKDNPRGSRRIPPLDHNSVPDKAFTELYSVPNGAQAPTEEGEASGAESQEEWDSDATEDDDDDDDDDEDEEEEEEEEVVPPRSERRSKLVHDPATQRGKGVATVGQSTKRPRTTSPALTKKAPKQSKVAPSKPTKLLPKMKVSIPTISGAATSKTSGKADDHEMEDATTSNPAPSNVVITLPDDDEDEEPLKHRRSRKASAGGVAQDVTAPETLVAGEENTPRHTVSFAVPLTSAHPASSSAAQPSFFTTHHVPEDQASAAEEAIRQAGIMMEQVKAIRDASQAAYDASSALQSNVQKSCDLAARYTDLKHKHIQLELDLKLAQENLTKAKEETKGKVKEAEKKKDLELSEKIKLADEKLASVTKLEEENTNLKADKIALTDKINQLTGKKNDLEAFLSGLAKKLFLMLEEFCRNFEEETSQLELNLDPVNSPVNDEVAMNVFRLESRVAAVVDYLARLKVATSRVDSTLWPRVTLPNDLESLMARLNAVPDRVQEWKKSSARCGADVALCLARVHCKDV